MTLEKDHNNGMRAGGPQAEDTDSRKVTVPSIALPKGGGALRGIDEKFELNPANGTGTFAIPVPLSAGRSGFTPQLSLSYNSGAGNSAFGLGWSLESPSITRKTDRQLPRYRHDADDVFTLSGLEDLVPALKETAPGLWQPDTKAAGVYAVTRYRPRIEGGFTRIEKIAHPDGVVYWKTTTKDNVVTFFGRHAEARIADPRHTDRIFSWLPEFSYDDKGNWIRYIYKDENLDNVPQELYERNRHNGVAAFTNKYLKRIIYGNRTPYTPDPAAPFELTEPADAACFFELVLDYGEHDPAVPMPAEAPGRLWTYRPDAFSSYRPGFELRTSRLCTRLLMFHHFAEALQPDGAAFGSNYLVRSLDLTYEPSSINGSGQAEVSYLTRITQAGYIRQQDGTYQKKITPPMDFGYQELKWNTAIKTVDRENLMNAPAGLTGNYQWVDLYGEGISGILTEQGETWYYKSNLGAGEDGSPAFTVARPVAPKPSYNGLATGAVSVQDLAASGEKQIVVEGEELQGYFELGEETQWKPFKNFTALTNINPADPHLRRIDLTGDGQSELVISAENAFIWYASKGKEGYEAAVQTAKAIDEEKGPAIVFADRELTIFLADMTGDGLTDIVRIRNGETCYWANMGYGKFSARVNMANAPRFDHPGSFNPRYLHLADISGTGTTDLVYVHKDKCRAFLNLSGNAFSDPHEIQPFPPADGNTAIAVTDLMGTGTACIVWSSDLLHHRQAPMRYLDLMGGKKPHVMIKFANNTGRETSLQYKSATWFYLKDKRNGTPWITKLPFPVQVVTRSETIDRVSGSKFVVRYAYHHGCFDHHEREFRGFGMVEQWDTEHYEAFKEDHAFPAGEDVSHIPPVHTRSWYHTGLYTESAKISRQFENEYYSHAALPALPDTSLPAGLTGDETREALRALKGSLLRREVYADDGTEEEAIPYSIQETRAHLMVCQPAMDQRHAVFYVCNCETLGIHLERNPDDPRISHSHTLEIDKYGNLLRSLSIVYPRLMPEFNEQDRMYVTLTDAAFVNADAEDNWYRLGVPWQQKLYEVTGLTAPAGKIYSKEELNAQWPLLVEIPYEAAPDGTRQKRVIEHARTTYLKNDQSAPLPPGTIESLALPYKTFTLAFNENILTAVYGNKVTTQMLHNAGYGSGDILFGEQPTDWWKRSGHQLFDTGSFYLPQKYIDPFDAVYTLTYDAPKLLPIVVEDPLGNQSKAENDYRVLQPWQLTNQNDTVTEAAFDALGMVVATSVRGSEQLVPKGDAPISTYELRTPAGVQDVIDNPHHFLQGATAFFFYDMLAYLNHREPIRFVSMARETHESELAPGATSPVQFMVGYSDGFGRELLTKAQAENGLAPQRDGNMDLVLNGGEVAMALTDDRWVGNGRTIYNNKGLPVKQYEPYFDSTWQYNEENELRMFGVTPYLHYDALGRSVRTDMPDGSFTKVAFGAWHQKSYDQNDTVQDSTWFAERGGVVPQAGDQVPDETNARLTFLTAIHHNTPITQHIDTLGRPFLSVAHNKSMERDNLGIITAFPEELLYTRTLLDIEGKPLKIIDPLNAEANAFAYPTDGLPRREVIQYLYSIDGQQLYENSMDAGERWILHDVEGNVVHSWDARQHTLRNVYDMLRRLTQIYLKAGDAGEKLVEYLVYGKNTEADRAKNLNGQLVLHFDNAGMIKNELADFKGNLARSTRSLIAAYKESG